MEESASRSAGHAADEPVHASAGSQAPADARHSVPPTTNPSAGQKALLPVQLSARSQTSADARQIPPVTNPSAGQAALEPLQDSATSQKPADGRHSVPPLPGVYTHPVTGLHVSTEHTLPSLQFSAGTDVWQCSSSAPMSGAGLSRVSPSMSFGTAARKTPAFSMAVAALEMSRCRSVSDTKFGATFLEAASLPVAVCQLASVAASVPPVAAMLTVRPILKLPVAVTNRSLLSDVRFVKAAYPRPIA